MRTLPATLRALTLAMGLCALGLVGCQAERSVQAPAEPTWSYHDGSTQLSNNDAWNQMIPASALLRLDVKRVASVEESTAAKKR